MMSFRDDMLAMGAKRRVPPGAAKRRKTTDQVMASTDGRGSTRAVFCDRKQAADNAREYIARPSAADPNKVKQLPAKATTAAQTAPARIPAKPLASEAIPEQKSTSDAAAQLIVRTERLREIPWHTRTQKDAQQKIFEEKMKRIEAEATQKAKQEALAKAEAARKAVEELLAEEKQAAHQAAAKKAKKDRRKAKKQQQQEEELLTRQQQQEEELLQRQQQQQGEVLLQHQHQQEEEQQRIQQEMRHQQQLQEEQKLQQQKQAKQHAQKLQEQLQGQELQQKLQPQVQELHEDQTQQEWQEQQRQWEKQQPQQQQKQQHSVEQPSLQVHTQQAGHAPGGSSTGAAANTISSSKGDAAAQTDPLLSPELLHVKQGSGLRSSHRQIAKLVRLDHTEPGVGGQHEGGVVDCSHVTTQQKRFAAPHHLLCCPITQVHYFLLCNVLSTSDSRHPAKVSWSYVHAVFALKWGLHDELS